MQRINAAIRMTSLLELNDYHRRLASEQRNARAPAVRCGVARASDSSENILTNRCGDNVSTVVSSCGRAAGCIRPRVFAADTLDNDCVAADFLCSLSGKFNHPLSTNRRCISIEIAKHDIGARRQPVVSRNSILSFDKSSGKA